MGRYEEIRDSFEWQQVWDTFEGERDGQFNVGYEAVGKHAVGDRRDELAVRIVDFVDGGVAELTYGELDAAAGRLINYFRDLGLSEGDRIATMLEPCTELYATIFASWLGGFQLVPLSPLFGPDAANYRISDSDAKAIVVSSDHRETISPGEAEGLEYVLLTDDEPSEDIERSFEAVADYDSDYRVAKTDADGTCTVQYTSGTTGAPKGVLIKQSILVSMYPGFTWAADHRPEHEYFGAGPPAWSYGLFGCTAFALSTGMGTTAYRGKFDPERFARVVEEHEITNLFAPPTLLRQLSNAAVDLDSSELALDIVATAGEPLDSETIDWATDVLDAKIVDHYGFTEGAMAINNYAFDDWTIKPGSMGKPAPGFDVQILDRQEDTPVPQGEVGEIAIRIETAQLNANRYLNQPEKSAEMWGGEWLRTSDLGRIDEDGYLWFEGRADDVILSAGHRIGPTEVENTLLNHEAVAEAAVVGLPDDERGEIVAAFLVLRDGYSDFRELREDIQQYVRGELSKTKYPREIIVREDLPKTNSGKIQRAKLREQ